MIRTWLPLETFVSSATILHDAEVHRQREHALFVLEVLAGQYQHMKHNPTVNMWRGSELILVAYGVAMAREWRTRGNRDKLGDRIYAYGQEALEHNVWTPADNGKQPWWLGHPGFHLSHKSGLIQKRPEFYRSIWPGISDQLPMVMPGSNPPGR